MTLSIAPSFHPRPIDTIETFSDRSSQTNLSLSTSLENFFSHLEVSAVQFYDSVSASTNAIFKETVEEASFPPLLLPDEVIAHIFSHLSTSSDFDAFATTSHKMGKIAHCLPVYVFYPVLHTHVLVHHDQFKKTAAALIQTLWKRSFTQKEASRVGGWALKSMDCENQEPMEQCAQAERVFYNTVKRCCFKEDEKINNAAFSAYLRAAFKHLIGKAACDSVAIKLQTSVDGLCDQFYRDMIEDFIDLPAECITPDSFQQKVEEMKPFFAKKEIAEIEASLRQVSKLKHGYSFKKLAESCLYSTSKCSLFHQTKQQLITTKVATTKAEILGLCGSQYATGKIHDAFLKVQEHARKLELLQQKHEESFNYYDCMCFNLESLTQVHEIDVARSQLMFAQNHYAALIKRLNNIAEWLLKGNISAEKSKIELTAKLIVLKNGFFYDELCREVTKTNKEDRSLALHEILEEDIV